MNNLIGEISNIKSDEHFSIVEMIIDGNVFKSIIIETPETVPFLKTGNKINIMFKESEVSIAKDLKGRISLQNKIPCIIKGIEKGKLLSKIILDFNSKKIVSVITTGAVEQLELKENDDVLALVKTNEVILAPYDRS
ncbi:MAG: TOBE domain-containing protein [Ignavibacteriaceae bacterium]